MIKRLHATVTGRVQGVGFRYFVQNAGNSLNLVGWVRNLPDGSVETEAEGDEDRLEQFRQMLWQGPVLSRVDEVNEKYIAPLSSEKSFSVKH